MVDYISAFKRPFQDIGKLILGTIIMAVPIISFIGTGYILKSVKGYSKAKFKLPKWQDWGENFIIGLKACIIGLIYAIPAILLLLLVPFAGGMNILAVLSGSPEALLGISSSIKSVAPLLIILLLYCLFVAYILPAAVLHFVNKGKFTAAFKLKEITKKAFSMTYLPAWLIAMLYGIVLVVVLKLINPLLPMVVGFLVACTEYTLLGEAYMKAK